jgi:hypothetical protein
MGEEVYQLSIEPDAIAEYLITGWVKQTRSNVIRYFRNRITLQTRETRPQQIVAAVDPAVAQHKPGPKFLHCHHPHRRSEQVKKKAETTIELN